MIFGLLLMHFDEYALLMMKLHDMDVHACIVGLRSILLGLRSVCWWHSVSEEGYDPRCVGIQILDVWESESGEPVVFTNSRYRISCVSIRIACLIMLNEWIKEYVMIDYLIIDDVWLCFVILLMLRLLTPSVCCCWQRADKQE